MCQAVLKPHVHIARCITSDIIFHSFHVRMVLKPPLSCEWRLIPTFPPLKLFTLRRLIPSFFFIFSATLYSDNA